MTEWRDLGEVTGPGISPGTRAYAKDVADGGHLFVMLSRDNGEWHLSISHRYAVVNGKPLAGRIPTWEEIKEARYRFVPDRCYMAMILPPKSEYVALHETCMHLWEIDIEPSGKSSRSDRRTKRG